MGSRGCIKPVTISRSTLNPQRAYRRLTHEDDSRGPCLHRDGGQQHARVVDTNDRRRLGIAASTISRELGRHRVKTGRGRGESRETRYHARVAHHHTMRSCVRTRPLKLDCHALRSLGHRLEREALSAADRSETTDDVPQPAAGVDIPRNDLLSDLPSPLCPRPGIVTARIDRRQGVAFSSFSKNTCRTIAVPRCPTVVNGGLAHGPARSRSRSCCPWELGRPSRCRSRKLRDRPSSGGTRASR